MPQHKKKKRRRMIKFIINEISMVDNPAQEGALMTIMKRADDPLEVLVAEAFEEYQPKGRPDIEKTDSVPLLTSTEDGHTHLIWFWGDKGGQTGFAQSEGEEQVHDHPWVIGTDGLIEIGENDGHSHTVSAEAVMAAMRELISGEDLPPAVVDVVFAQHADGPSIDTDDIEEFDDIVVKRFLSQEFPIRCRSDLLNAIGAWDHAEDQGRVASYIAKRAQALDLEDELPDELATTIAKDAGPDGGDRKEGSKMVDPKKAAVKKTAEGDDEKAAEKLKKLNAELAISKAFGELTDDQKAHHEKLEADGRAEYLKMAPEARQKVIDDALLKRKVIFKSAAGDEYTAEDDSRVIAMAKRDDVREIEFQKMRIREETAAYAKRATEELSHFKGSEPVKIAILKAFDTIEDPAVKKEAMEFLKAFDDNVTKSFDRAGTAAVPRIRKSAGASAAEDADDELTTLAKAHQAENPDVDFFTAYTKMVDAHPELIEKAVPQLSTPVAAS